ncbi:hypothetical protein ASZ90_009726 [hydrocarbon metagenome]|uniref:Uncharacterized protein n=1 Tax=hydrocarbon metagenome TaxID=938273 RepID=A0A0W8FI29_9ZZZZ
MRESAKNRASGIFSCINQPDLQGIFLTTGEEPKHEGWFSTAFIQSELCRRKLY